MKRFVLHLAAAGLLVLAGLTVAVTPDGGTHCAGCIPGDNTVTVTVL